MPPAGASGKMRNRMFRSDPRSLNRALLARQLLLAREPLGVVETVNRLVGLQAQEPIDPYVALWTRLAPFDPAELAAALTNRAVVRTALQRSTIHLVTARDCLALRPVVQPVHDRALKGTFGGRLDGIDLDALAARGRRLVEEKPRTFAELGRALAADYPDRDELALGLAVRTRVALVQPPPRGIWGKSGRALHVTAESWLGAPLGPPIALEDLVLRYLAAFGPASAKDAQVWCGLTRLGEVFERLRPRLLSARAEDGTELFDLPEAPRPEPETAAPPRFLPQFDNVLLSHADRSRIVPAGIGERIYRQHGHWSPLLVDGMLRGTWKLRRERGAATLEIELGDELPKPDRTAVEREGERLLEFAAGGGELRFLK
jgi:Winged helix DNA-binding domain